MRRLLATLVMLGAVGMAACGGGSNESGGGASDDLLRLPDGNFTEAEMQELYGSMAADPSLSPFICGPYRGRSDADVQAAAIAGYDDSDPASFIRPVTEVKVADFLRIGIIIREECERITD